MKADIDIQYVAQPGIIAVKQYQYVRVSSLAAPKLTA